MRQSDIDAAERPSAAAPPAPPASPRRPSRQTITRTPREEQRNPTRDEQLEHERMLGTNDLVAESYLELALLAAQPVCRVTVVDANRVFAGHATGFLIAPHILLTNWHVFRDVDEARNSWVEFDYRLDLAGKAAAGHRFTLRPDAFFVSDRELDYAAVAVAPVSEDGRTPLSRYGYHRLGPNTAKGGWMTIIQHPAGQPRQFAIRENRCVPAPAGVEDPRFIWYESDTAQGSSGSPVFDDAFRLVALHHLGRARRVGDKYRLRDGRLVDTLEGVDDTQVDWESNEGVCADGLVAHIRGALQDATRRDSEHGRELLRALEDDLDIISRAQGGELGRAAPTPTADREVRIDTGGGGMQISIGQVAQMFVGGQPPVVASTEPRVVVAAPATIAVGSEIAKQPIVDRRYSKRTGYKPKFLGTNFEVPLPRVKDMGSVAKLDGGEHVIPYQHFSVVMNKRRRLAIYTASNVDFRAAAHPSGGDYNRDALGGFGPNDTETWITDPRLPEEHQLPDRFYNRDRTAFDKGHLVRREDVCFGSSYAVIQRANGDTYHTTNCSPQVLGFNRSNKQGVWGLLENNVGSEGKREKYQVFAGPVFDDDDPWFDGVDDRGPLEIQIPQVYWKVIVARGADGLEAFGFRMEQDLSKVDFTAEEEFAVKRNLVEHMCPIADIARAAGLVFDAVIVAADQYENVEGEELSRPRSSTAAPRRRPARDPAGDTPARRGRSSTRG
jgi:endonuclease G